MAYKQFTPDVLSSADVNTYLMKQSVVTFADATTRTNTLGTSIPEGMVTYLADSNTFWYYDGSAWVNLGNVMRFASAAARTSALPSPVEGMVSYLQDTDELQVYNGASWLTVVVTSDDEGFTTTGNITANTSGADGGLTQRTWTGGVNYQSIATTNMTGNEYVLITDGTDTILGSGNGGFTRIRNDANNNAQELYITNSYAAFNGTVAIGPPGNVGSNTSSQLHVRADNPGGKGGEISIVNYSNTANTHAALNFGVDASSYGSDTGNAQVRATNVNGTNMATELGFYTWNGSGWGRRMRVTADTNPVLRVNSAAGIGGGRETAVGTTNIHNTLYRGSIGSSSSLNTWVTLQSCTVNASANHNTLYFVMFYGFSCFISAAGGVQSRVLVQPAAGGSYVLGPFNHFSNEAFSHKTFTGGGESYGDNQYANIYLQFYGSGVTAYTDANDYSWMTVMTP